MSTHTAVESDGSSDITTVVEVQSCRTRQLHTSGALGARRIGWGIPGKGMGGAVVGWLGRTQTGMNN